jgi:hypothetical protein
MNLISFAWALLCAPMLEIGTDVAPLRQLELGADSRFSVTYWHSMYNAPLTEDFLITPQRQLRLVALRSKHGGVLEYLGVEDTSKEHAMDRLFPSVSFLVATKQAQVLSVGTRSWSFREFAGPGDRLVLSAAECQKK